MELHQCAKFHQSRSIRSGDITFFPLFKMMAAKSSIIEILKFYWLIGSGWRRYINVRNFVKVDQTVFEISLFLNYSRWRSRVAAILDFRNSETLLAEGSQRAEMMHHRAKFRPNLLIHCRAIAIFQFFKMAAVRHLEFVWDMFGV